MHGDLALSILRRLIDQSVGNLSPAAARGILELELPGVDRERMNELAAKSNYGALTAEEGEEYDGYIAVADLLSLWKSKARFVLNHHPSAA